MTARPGGADPYLLVDQPGWGGVAHRPEPHRLVGIDQPRFAQRGGIRRRGQHMQPGRLDHQPLDHLELVSDVQERGGSSSSRTGVCGASVSAIHARCCSSPDNSAKAPMPEVGGSGECQRGIGHLVVLAAQHAQRSGMRIARLLRQLADGQRAGFPQLLGQHRQPARHLTAAQDVDIVVTEQGSSCQRRQQPGQRLEQGRLARPVRATRAVTLPGSKRRSRGPTMGVPS